MQGIVAGLLAHMRSTDPVPGSFAHLLLHTQDPATKQPLADQLMIPEIASLFFAGARLLSFTCLCVGIDCSQVCLMPAICQALQS